MQVSADPSCARCKGKGFYKCPDTCDCMEGIQQCACFIAAGVRENKRRLKELKEVLDNLNDYSLPFLDRLDSYMETIPVGNGDLANFLLVNTPTVVAWRTGKRIPQPLVEVFIRAYVKLTAELRCSIFEGKLDRTEVGESLE